MGGFLACDWGTTNLRSWVIDPAGGVGAARDFPLGIAVVGRDAPRRFEEEVRPAMGAERLPALLCGMVGAELGWGGAGYRACPAGIEAMAGGLVTVAPGVRIVPGLRCEREGGVDVMRGEETQVFGWLAADPGRARGRRLVCCPGTHSKWAIVEDGVVTGFTTYMTGELYALAMTHSILRSQAPADDAAAFEAGLAAAGDGGGLAARLFSARARVAAGGADPATTPSYVSGVLIGAEVAAAVAALEAGSPAVDLIGAPALCRRYGAALARRRIAWTAHDGDAASLAGLVALHRQDEAA